MKKILPDVVVDVARECYDRLDRLQPGSEDAETVEHAISLALSERRSAKAKDLLLNDVLRNARHSVRRSRARYVQTVEETGYLAAEGIATGIHYAIPCHRQPACAAYATPPLPVVEAAAGRLLSLPMYPHLAESDVARVAAALERALGRCEPVALTGLAA